MIYHQVEKIYNIKITEEIVKYREKDQDITKLIVYINLADHNRYGFSLDLLNEIIEYAVKANSLTEYRIYHDSKGLVLQGRL